MRKTRFLLKGVILGMVFFMFGCFPKTIPYTGEKAFVSETGVPDYQDLKYWAAHPKKNSPSDSTNKWTKYIRSNKDVDVFFLHPTSFTDIKDQNISNARIDDPYINSKTDNTSILYQASIFNESCNIYAPRYRQAHIQRYYDTDTIRKKEAFQLAYQDVRSAFLTYMKDYNHERPFIIASHSQGTTHAKWLIQEFIDGKKLKDRMIAAYIVGIPVEKTYFKNLSVCKDSTQIGCLVSWRTYERGYEDEFVSMRDTSLIVVNPMHWKTDTSIATKEQHKGAILYNFRKVYKETHNAQILGNGLFISKPKFPGSFVIKNKNYHAGDFNLFYLDVREDVARRIKYYQQSRL